MGFCCGPSVSKFSQNENPDLSPSEIEEMNKLMISSISVDIKFKDSHNETAPSASVEAGVE